MGGGGKRVLCTMLAFSDTRRADAKIRGRCNTTGGYTTSVIGAGEAELPEFLESVI